MSYSNVISLDEAKAYLRVDHADSDTEITRMIKSALSLLENRTNIIMNQVNKDYYYLDGCVNVYDGPIIDTVTDATEYSREDYANYSSFTDLASNKKITLTVGDSNPPSEIIEAAYEMIDYWYYKNDGKANITLIPDSVQAVIDSNKRFII